MNSENNDAWVAIIALIAVVILVTGVMYFSSKEETVKSQQYYEFQLDSMKIAHDTTSNHLK